MRKSFNFFSLLFMLAVVNVGIMSCKEDKSDPDQVEVSQTQMSFAGDGGQQQIMVMSNTKWTISGMQGSITVNPTSGSGNSPVTITAGPNTTSNIMYYSLVVNAGSASTVISIQQQPAKIDPVGQSLADRVVGTYVGKLKSNDTLLEDAHPIIVTKLSDNAVSVSSSVIFNGTANFNLEESMGQIVFKNQMYIDFQMYVMNNTMNITYTTSSGYMLIYTGQK